MDATRFLALRQQFDALIELPGPERERQLADLPSDEAEHLRRLLDSDSVVDGFLQPPQVEQLAEVFGRPPERIGAWRVLSVLGSGGSATVYEAEGGTPPRRVALKVCRDPLPSGPARQRFVVEAATLARLNHPAIAQVHEAAVVDGSLPVFALELVHDASTLCQWVASQRLALDGVLQLFDTVCDAVSHAHQRGVIHRDLKSANVLVDGEGHPKLIDFGVARVTDPQRTAVTTQGEVLGTLASMAPEQLSGDPDHVDVRVDVYALGALLYELVTGRPPLDLAGMPLARAAEVVRSSVPVRPRRLVPELPGDLELILLKALEKERQRRYASVAALADDLGRLRRNEPVTARPPSLAYHATTFARRHRAAVAGGLVALLALVAATVVSVRFAFDAQRAETDARLAATREAVRATEADAARVLAEQQRARATALFERLLDSSQQFVFQAAAALDGVSGVLDERRLLLERAVQDLDLLGQLAPDDLDLALKRGRACLELGALLGGASSSHAGSYDAATDALQLAEDLGRQVLNGRPGDAAATALLVDALRNRGSLALGRADLPQAVLALQQALALMQAHALADDRASAVRRANLHDSLGLVFKDMGRNDDARLQMEIAKEGFAELAASFPGDVDLATFHATSLSKLALLDRNAERYASAMTLAAEAVDSLTTLHAAHPTLVVVHERLVETLQNLGQIELLAGLTEAAQAHIDAATERLMALLDSDPDDVQHLHMLVLVLFDRGNVARQRGEDLAVADPAAAKALLQGARESYLDCGRLMDGLREQGRLLPRYAGVRSRVSEQVARCAELLGPSTD